jgi:hypothetical protein
MWTNPADQKKWSTPYSCTPAVVVFVVMAVASLRAQTATTGADLNLPLSPIR